MAKRQKNKQVTASFHYLVKSKKNPDDADAPLETGFTENEFQQVINRLSNVAPLDTTDEQVIRRIKKGDDIPFNYYDEIDPGLHFGNYEGAYYGQKYRNNLVGEIDADSLNLRNFHYLITRLRGGEILIGVTYHGQFGDYDGIYSCLSKILAGDHRVASKTLKSISDEIGDGHPISLKLTYRKAQDRLERKPLFGSSGVIAIKNTDFGDQFEERVTSVANQIHGTDAEKKRALARIVNQDHMLELDSDDIIGCSAVVREDGRQRTVYFLGDNNFSTKFSLAVDVDNDGVADRGQVEEEIVRVMREKILPLLN